MASARVALGGLWVVSACVFGSACGRTPLADGDLIGNDGRGGSNTPRAGRSGGAASGAANNGSGGSSGGGPPVIMMPPSNPPPVVAGSGGTPAPTAGRAGGTAGSGTGGVAGVAGRAGAGGRAGGTGGRAGSAAGTVAPPPIGPDEPDPLNPQRCAIDEPTVLTIDPGGRSGEVQGWLESAPTLMFDDRYLPRFAGGALPMRQSDLALWWSIASLDEDDEGGEFYFYALSSDTVLAVAHGEIDASRLMYTEDVVGPIPVGEVVVWHHLPSDRYVAVRVEALYGTDRSRRELCAAIDASWVFAVPGTSKFPFLP